MKKQIVCLVYLFVLLSGRINAQDKSPETGLGETAIQFFEALIVERSTQKALKFVSKNAVVGECMLPDRLSGKKLSSKEIISVFREALDVDGVPRVAKLGDVLTSKGTNLMEGKVSLGEESEPYFQVFKIKETLNPQDIAYVCKFDERKPFRERVAKPDVRYLITRLKTGERSSIILTTLWVPEKTTWRILTLEISNDED